MPVKRPLILILMCLCLFGAGCSSNAGQSFSEGSTIFPIDAHFGRFYSDLGGKERIGPGISPKFPHNDKLYQYTVSVLMVYDPRAPEGWQYSLGKIGHDLAVNQKPTLSFGDKGIELFPAFTEVYQEMGGLEVVGAALTPLRYNPKLHRFEQYLEGAGFYQLEGETGGEVHLLSYGVWGCKEACSFNAPPNARLELPIHRLPSFFNFVKAHGTEFTGFALSEPYIDVDGRVVQIYENIVLEADPERSDSVSLQSLPELTGIVPDHLNSPTDELGYTFIQVKKNQGYNVPDQFIAFLDLHGGLALAGQPFTQPKRVTGKGLFQCFEALCLEQTSDASGNLLVRPMSLGYQYRQMVYPEQVSQPAPTPAQPVTLLVWESETVVSPGAELEIGVQVQAGGEPLPGQPLQLVLTLPDGSQQTYPMPPTDERGESRLRLNAVAGQNASIIPYQVCLAGACAEDSILVWDLYMSP